MMTNVSPVSPLAKRPRKRTFNKFLLNEPGTTPKTGHICMLCGFLPATQNKYRELQDHLVRAHFSEKIKSALPCCRPYICPEPHCAIEGKDWQALMRHYTGKHGILERYLNEIINSGFRPPPNPLNIKIGQRKSALQPAVPRHLVIKNGAGGSATGDEDREQDNDSGCGGDDNLSSTSSSPRSQESVSNLTTFTNIADITTPIPKEELFLITKVSPKSAKRRCKRNSTTSSSNANGVDSIEPQQTAQSAAAPPQLAFVFKRPKDEENAADTGLTFIDVNHFLASMPIAQPVANTTSTTASPLVLMRPSSGAATNSVVPDVGQAKMEIPNLGAQSPIVYAQPGDMFKLCQEHIKLTSQKCDGVAKMVSLPQQPVALHLQTTDNQARVVSTDSNQLPKMSVVSSAKGVNFASASPVYVQSESLQVGDFTSRLQHISDGCNLLPNAPVSSVRCSTVDTSSLSTTVTSQSTSIENQGLLQLSQGGCLSLGSGIDVIGTSPDGSVIYAAPSSTSTSSLQVNNNQFELGQVTIPTDNSNCKQTLPSLLKPDVIDQSNVMLNPDNQLIFIQNGGSSGLFSGDTSIGDPAVPESDCISYVACDENGNHFLIPSSMVQPSADLSLSNVIQDITCHMPVDYAKNDITIDVPTPCAMQTVDTTICDSTTTVDEIISSVKKDGEHAAPSSVGTTGCSNTLSLTIEASSVQDDTFVGEKFSTLNRLHSAMPIAI